MKTYLLTAAGVIFIAVIVSLLVPEGKLNKSVNFIIRLICILVLIQPITGIFNLKSGEVFENYIDYAYVSEIYAGHQSEELEKLILKEKGAETECSVEVEFKEGKFKVTAVTVEVAENYKNLIDVIYEYLNGLGYINISVYAEIISRKISVL